MKLLYTPFLRGIILCFGITLLLAACGNASSSGGKTTVTLGYFPNLTHIVALVGLARGTFQHDLGSKVDLQTKVFNAGPNEIQALLAGDIDIGFVGPSPAINGYTQSGGQALRIIGGASTGGVLFVVRPGAHIRSPQDLANKKIADPQVGGTQDVALRSYLQQHGLKTTDQGGNVQIVPTANSNILTLFKEGQIDGAWVPEPYATRLIVEDGGQVFLDERSLWPNGQFTTTLVVARTAFLNQHSDLVTKFLEAEVETVQYIQSNQQEALSLTNSQIKSLTGQAMPSKELTMAYSHMSVTYDPLTTTIAEQANRAYTLGFLRGQPNLGGIYNFGPLNSVLSSKGLATIAQP
jgi:NitT/TauT family transport system substrate-binding protein